jgi:RNA polymerase primary sigma factor
MAFSSESLTNADFLGMLVSKTDLERLLSNDEANETHPHTNGSYNKMPFVPAGFPYSKEETAEADADTTEPIAGRLPPVPGESSQYIEAASPIDTVGLYLREMSRVPLLNTEEELDLAIRIERASQAQTETTKLNGGNSAKRRQEMESYIQDGLRARDHLIKANTRLVVSIAKKYIGRGVPLLDLIQEGNLGLMKAVEKYDYQRGFRFSTYATWWIRQTITRAIAEQGRTIRVPVHMIDRIRQLFKTAHEMEQKLGRPPAIEELAEALELEPRKVQWMLRVSWLPLSLESPIGDDEESELGMFVEDNHSPTPTQITYHKMLREKIEEVLSTLSPREARILRLRFGLENGRTYTLEEVGKKFGLTRERIRQIEGKALRRLRHPCRSRLLREYL